MANKGVTQKNKISTKRKLFIILIALLFISTGFVILGGRDGKQNVYIESASTHGPQSNISSKVPKNILTHSVNFLNSN